MPIEEERCDQVRAMRALPIVDEYPGIVLADPTHQATCGCYTPKHVIPRVKSGLGWLFCADCFQVKLQLVACMSLVI